MKKGSTLKTSPKQGNLTAEYPTSTQKELASSTKGREDLNCRESSDLAFQDSKDFIRPHCLVGGVSVVQVFKESRKEGTKPTQAWEIQFFWEQVIPTWVDKAPKGDRDPDAFIILSM